jgi:hypothetical protein
MNRRHSNPKRKAMTRQSGSGQTISGQPIHPTALARLGSILPILGGALLAAGLLGACGGGKPAVIDNENAGAVVEHPDPSIGSAVFIGESNYSGLASDMKLSQVYWGRRVNIADSNGDVQLRDFVIAASVRDQTVFLPSVGTTITYSLKRNAVTDSWTLTMQSAEPVLVGMSRFTDVLMDLEANLTPVFDKGVEPGTLGPFSMVPRNATLVLVFDDLLQPHYDNGGWVDGYNGDVANVATGQLNKDLVKVRTGYPPSDPFEARVVLDATHGNLADFDNDGTPEFYPTRIVLSPTVSTIEAEVSDPPLTINSLGLPPSIVLNEANMALRIATILNPSVGQTQILRNASGHGLSYTGNGSNNNDTGTEDVVRAVRTGGNLTNDANNGFLLDEDPPRLMGDLAVLIQSPPVVDSSNPARFLIAQMGFSVVECSSSPKVGDVLEQSGAKAIILDPGTQNGPVVNNMIVEVIAPLGGVPLAGDARLQTPFVPGIDNPACFVTFSPAASLPPDEGVETDAEVVLSFSEPMDPGTIKPYDTFTVTRVLGTPTPFDYVIGRVIPDPDLRSFSWKHPEVDFNHVSPLSEEYYVNLDSGSQGPTDLSGNALAFTLPQTSFKIGSTEPSVQRNAGFAMRFEEADEFFDDGLFELRNGQLLYDPVNERILPRPVSRFDVAADRNQPLPGSMTLFVGGIQTPLSSLGSKLHTLWRYCDVGFSLTDETNINMDVEGLSWAPVGGSVVTDTYEEFQVLLCHSEYLPDEYLNTGSGFPQWPASGLKQIYANNYNDPLNDPGDPVHPKQDGYVVNPANLYTASSGTTMLPWPLNQDLALEDYRYYTWRDTALTALGAPSGAGAMLDQEELVLLGAIGAMGVNKTYSPQNVPTIGLPLLMDFRCYSDDEALGLNALDISLAANSSPRPNFRAFSTGGYDTNNNPQYVDPDVEETASGGYSPTSNPPGAPTPGTDNSFYVGEMALVTRVSRIHSIWFDTGFPQATFNTPLVEPEPGDQPNGTAVVLAYRGAIALNNANLLTDASTMGPYGDPSPGAGNGPTFLQSDPSWKDDISGINSAGLFQFRISFISNAATDKTAELQSLAFAYFDGTDI